MDLSELFRVAKLLPPISDRDVLTIEQWCRLVGQGEPYAKEWLKNHQITAFQFRCEWLISGASIIDSVTREHEEFCRQNRLPYRPRLIYPGHPEFNGEGG